MFGQPLGGAPVGGEWVSPVVTLDLGTSGYSAPAHNAVNFNFGVATTTYAMTILATVTTQGVLKKQINLTRTATVTTSSTIKKAISKVLTATVSTLGQLFNGHVYHVTLLATVTTTALIKKRISKSFLATVTTSGVISSLLRHFRRRQPPVL